MGTVLEKANKIKETKDKLKEAINDGGGQITNDTVFNDYADEIKNIYIDAISDGVDNLYNNFPKITGEGSEITLDTEEAPINIILEGNTSQDGTPTPDTPVPIKKVTGNNTITVCGKNLLDYNLTKLQNNNTAGTWNNNIYTFNGVTFTYNEDGSITANGQASSSFSFYINRNNKDFTTLSAGTYYFTSHEETGANDTWKLFIQNIGTVFSIYGSGSNKEVSRTISEDTNIQVSIYIYSGYNPNGATFYPMISTTSGGEYEQYQSQTYPINLGSLECCKIDNYSDEFYLDNGNWYLKKNIGKVVLNGTENWFLNASPAVLYLPFTGYLVSNTLTTICDYYKAIKNRSTSSLVYQNGNNIICLYNGTTLSSHRIYVRDDRFTNADDFEDWLTTHNVTLYYILETPIVEPITDTTLIQQLENINNNAKSYSGTTIIKSLPSDINNETIQFSVTALKNIDLIESE